MSAVIQYVRVIGSVKRVYFVGCCNVFYISFVRCGVKFVQILCTCYFFFVIEIQTFTRDTFEKDTFAVSKNTHGRAYRSTPA